MPLTNKYLRYTPEITFEVFEKIWDKLLEYGWASNAGYTIQDRWREFSGDYQGFQSVNPTTKKFFTGSIPDNMMGVTETTVDEILNFSKPTENSTILYKDLEVDKVYHVTWGSRNEYKALFRFTKDVTRRPFLNIHNRSYLFPSPSLGHDDNLRLPTKDEVAWFEYCEKNNKYISYEDFIKLPVEKPKANTWYKHTEMSDIFAYCFDINQNGIIISSNTGSEQGGTAVFTKDMKYWIEVGNIEHKLIQQILLDKANRDYPVGTRFISALRNDSNPYKGNVCKSFHWNTTSEGREVLFNGNSCGFIYDNGVWAKKVEDEKPVTLQEIIDFKDSLFYVECTYSESKDSFIKGKKYLASEYEHDSERFILEQPKENGLSKGSDFPYKGGLWKFKKIEPEKSYLVKSIFDQTPIDLIPQPFEMEISKRVILFPVVEEITLK